MLSRTTSRFANNTRGQLQVRSFATGASPSNAVFQTSQLKNGIRVATAAFGQNPIASVGVFINAGSRNESGKTIGAAAYLRRLGFKATQNLSEIRFVREFELLSANYNVGIGREQIGYFSDVTADKVPQVVELLSEAVSPRIAEYDVRTVSKDVKADTERFESDAKALLLELVHREAFRNVGLGQTVFAPSFRVKKVDDKAIKDFVNAHYTNDRIVIVGTGGVEHSALVKAVEAAFGSRSSASGAVGSTSASSTSSTPYMGGELKIPGDFNTHLAVAFEGVGLNASDFYAAAVLQHILGGGQKYAKEELGHGVASRLNRNVVEAKSWAEEARAFNYSYTDSGVFGVYGIAQAGGNAAALADSLLTEVKAVSNSVTSEELSRGKEMFRSSVFFGSETKSQLLEFLGTQLNSQKSAIKSPEEFARGVDAVTAEQVQKFAKKILQSTPTLVVLGDVTGVPTIDKLKKFVA